MRERSTEERGRAQKSREMVRRETQREHDEIADCREKLRGGELLSWGSPGEEVIRAVVLEWT
jgi:hypothetical protein